MIIRYNRQIKNIKIDKTDDIWYNKNKEVIIMEGFIEIILENAPSDMLECGGAKDYCNENK